MKVLFVSIIVVLIDQLSKLLVKGFSIPFLNINYEGMYHGQRIPIIGDLFRLTFIENPGMAFGIDPGDGFKLWISIFSLIASVGIVIYMFLIRNHRLSLRIALAFILGGAIGNLIDRMFYGVFYGYAPLFYGKVVDFLDFDFFDITVFGRSYDRWPIFNFADAAVTIGVLILIFFYRDKREDIPAKQPLYAEELNASAKADTVLGDESPDGVQKNESDENESTLKGNSDDEDNKGEKLPL